MTDDRYLVAFGQFRKVDRSIRITEVRRFDSRREYETYMHDPSAFRFIRAEPEGLAFNVWCMIPYTTEASDDALHAPTLARELGRGLEDSRTLGGDARCDAESAAALESMVRAALLTPPR